MDLIPLASLVNPVISVLSGLGGVALGGLIASRAHRTERRNARVRDKLDKFYAPLLGMRLQIRAKREVRLKVSNSGGAAWQSLFTGVYDPKMSKAIEAERWPAFEKLIEYSDQQLRDELVPIYRQMLKLFADNMGSRRTRHGDTSQRSSSSSSCGTGHSRTLVSSMAGGSISIACPYLRGEA